MDEQDYKENKEYYDNSWELGFFDFKPEDAPREVIDNLYPGLEFIGSDGALEFKIVNVFNKSISSTLNSMFTFFESIDAENVIAALFYRLPEEIAKGMEAIPRPANPPE